jgi:hypothetical protein
MKNNTEQLWVAEVREVIEWKLVDKDSLPLSFVYVIQCEETSRFKIGITQNLGQRLKEIQTNCPTRLRLVFCFQTVGQDVERCLHKHFEMYRMHGEWFSIPHSEMYFFSSIEAAYESRMDPLDECNMDGLYQDVDRSEKERGAYEVKPQPMKEFWKTFGTTYQSIIEKSPI